MSAHGFSRNLLQFCRLSAATMVFGLTTQAHAVCYVKSNATGLNNGTSWTNGYTNLQFALLDSSCAEIWVGKGVYKPTLGTDQTISFVIPPGTAIYGGFEGDESDRRARNPIANVTVLSGDIDNNDTHEGSNEIDDSHWDIVGNNSTIIITMDGSSSAPVTSSTILDGFTVTGAGPASGGATGLYCDGSHPGGVCSPTLSNLVFSGNADHGIFAIATDGGNVSPNLQNVVFVGNQSAMYSIVYSSTAKPKLSDITFVNNSSGAFINESVGGSANPVLERVTFNHNSSDNGGAFNNYATGVGGVANPSLTNVTFFENDANYGGAFFNQINSSGVAEPTLLNVTFLQNTATVAGGAIFSHAYSTGPTGLSNPKLYNAILWNNSVFEDGPGPEIDNDGGTSFIDYSVVQGGCPTGTSCTHAAINSDPLLAPIADNGGSTKTSMVSAGSPALDAGADSICPSTDQRGIPRPQGSHCDLGAVERQAVEDIIFRDGFQQ